MNIVNSIYIESLKDNDMTKQQLNRQLQESQDKARIMTALVNNKGHRRATSIDLCMSERTLYRYLTRLNLHEFARNI